MFWLGLRFRFELQAPSPSLWPSASSPAQAPEQAGVLLLHACEPKLVRSESWYVKVTSMPVRLGLETLTSDRTSRRLRRTSRHVPATSKVCSGRHGGSPKPTAQDASSEAAFLAARRLADLDLAVATKPLKF